MLEKFFKSKRDLKREDHIILIEPREIDIMGNFAPYLSKFDEVFGHTPLGLVFVRNSNTKLCAVVVPFESNFYDVGEFESPKEYREKASIDDGLLPESYLRIADVNLIRKRLGSLGKDEIYIPAPYPFLGGNCDPSSYDKGNLWVFINIVSQMVCGDA